MVSLSDPRVRAEEMEGAGDVQPALVDAEGLHQVGVLLVDLVDPAGEVPVLAVVGREKNQLGALFSGLPDGLGSLDSEGFGRLVLGQDDAVAALRVSAHRHRQVAQLRVVQQLHRGVEAVQIAVKNDPVHGCLSPLLRISLLYPKGGEKSNGCSNSKTKKKGRPGRAALRGHRGRSLETGEGSGCGMRRGCFPARNSPAHRAVKGATVTRPKEPMTVWMISAATYL